jgi:amidase
MALQAPTIDELQAIAAARGLSATPPEIAAIRDMIVAQLPALERIDVFAPAAQPSVLKYRERTVAAGRPDRKDDPLNAIVRRCHVRGAGSGKLAGKRIGVKDSVCVAGVPASGGSHVLQGYVSDLDATIVARMLDAGAEIVATLNMDDFALSGDGRTCAYGPTLNPHSPQHCSGGSSSGSAAALYYDGIDMTIGTDQGGSIRIPASWSGVVGIKPTYSLVPYTGVMSIDPTVDHVGPLARSVPDAALLLEVIAGKDPLDPRQREVPVQPYTESLGTSIAGLKLGVLREGFAHPGAEPDVNDAVRRAIGALTKLGARAEEVSIPAHRDAGSAIFAIVPEGMALLAHAGLQTWHQQGLYNAGLAEFFGAHFAERSEHEAPSVKLMLVMGDYLTRRFHGRLYAKAQNWRASLTAEYQRALGQFDALVMPTTPMKAYRQDEQSPYGMLGNTAPFDITGHPALSVPCGMSRGLPIGLMVVGRHFDDATVLRIGHAYEQSVDWRKA